MSLNQSAQLNGREYRVEGVRCETTGELFVSAAVPFRAAQLSTVFAHQKPVNEGGFCISSFPSSDAIGV